MPKDSYKDDTSLINEGFALLCGCKSPDNLCSVLFRKYKDGICNSVVDFKEITIGSGFYVPFSMQTDMVLCVNIFTYVIRHLRYHKIDNFSLYAGYEHRKIINIGAQIGDTFNTCLSVDLSPLKTLLCEKRLYVCRQMLRLTPFPMCIAAKCSYLLLISFPGMEKIHVDIFVYRCIGHVFLFK